MPRIDEMPEYRARLSRTTHDLSHKFGFTATVAHLLPVFHDFLQAGETVELGVSYNLRTQPLQSAAMVDIHSHVEYFFVPAFLLYEPFGNAFYNVDEQYSSMFPPHSNIQMVQSSLPVLDFTDLLTEMQSYDTTLVGFEEWHNHVYRLFDMLGYNNYRLNATSSNPSSWNPNVFPYPILAYNCIYQYYYRLDNRERFNQLTFNWDEFYDTPVVHTSSISNWFELVRLHYRPKDSDYFTDCKVSPLVDVLNLNAKNSLPMADSWLSRVSNGQEVLSSGSHGLGSYPSTTIRDNAPTGANYNNPSDNIQTLFGLRSQPAYTQSSAAGYITQNGTDINTANIRALFANEKLNSITGRARKHYDDQVLAHLGFKVPHDIKHEISCFGHDRGLVHIGEVISTSNTVLPGTSPGTYTGSAIGEIAGKGYGSLQSKTHKFTAPCHGVVMAILSFVPDVCYGNTYLKANAVTDRNSFYNPEYDSLGMQPIFGYEGNPQNPNIRNSIIGWQYRYEQWKRRYNRVTKAFAGQGNLDSWMLDFQAPDSVTQPNADNFEDYLHNPSELNQIMLVNYHNTAVTGDESEVYDGDPFVVNAYIHCKKVSTMSDFALPRLDA